jgi:O-antigen ligase
MMGWRPAFERVSAAAIYLLAVSVFLAPAGVAAALVLLWVGFLGEILAGRRETPLRPWAVHPLVWLAAAFVLYVLVQPLLLGLMPTGGGAPDFGTAVDWARLAVFVPAAHALAANRARMPRLLLLALAGLVAGMLLRLDWGLLLADPAEFFDNRGGFGFGALAFGLYSGTALLGLVLLRRRCWIDAAGRAHWWRIVPWLAALALVLQGFMMTKSRGAWLALLAALAVGLWQGRRDRRRLPGTAAAGGGRRSLATVGVIVVMAALVGLNGGRIVERFSDEWDTVGAMAGGEIAYDRSSSVSQRWHAQLFGLQAWAARPLLGWGAGTTRALMDASGSPALRSPEDEPLKHLHNSYLELAVQLGAIGLLLFLALHLGLVAVVAGRLRVAGTGGDTGRDILVFLLSALVLLLVWDLFDYRAVRQDWRGYWALVAGAALGIGLGDRRAAGGRDRSGSGPVS